jgi:hypothetical protein
LRRLRAAPAKAKRAADATSKQLEVALLPGTV